ncbi:DUF6048 family protein, partial [Flavobacterium sp.]|uniref:DUF6048 family protein n=1 Tax=Flavobacterium sp. TaxID=239 RepID=UPI00286D74F7
FSFLIVMISFSIQSQEIKNEITVKPKDTIPSKIDRYGVRFGIDLYKLTKSFYEKNYKGLELIGDYRISKNYYLAAEIGNENKTSDDTRLNFTTKGSYIKAGFDYNSYENWLNMENMVYIGLRYSASTFSQELNNYKIYNRNTFFGETPNQYSGEKFDGLSAQWLEFVAGIKAKVFNNVFVGFNFRINLLLATKKPETFENLYIPGFNRTYDGDFGAGFNYTVSYLLPIYKKQKIVK